MIFQMYESNRAQPIIVIARIKCEMIHLKFLCGKTEKVASSVIKTFQAENVRSFLFFMCFSFRFVSIRIRRTRKTINNCIIAFNLMEGASKFLFLLFDCIVEGHSPEIR